MLLHAPLPRFPRSQEFSGRKTPGLQPWLIRNPPKWPGPLPGCRQEYHVGIYKGRVGVFQAGKGTPVLLSETLAHRLPQGDIDLLQKGIPADSPADAPAIVGGGG